jgi:hypothetical protein
MQQPGWPDFYLAHPKFIGWIETKGATTILRPLQITTITRLRSVGVFALVLRFNTEREFTLEDEKGVAYVTFQFKNWRDGAIQLLNLLEEIKCGTRKSEELQSSV